MDDCRNFRSLHALENLDEFFNIVSFFKIFVVESPRLEPVVLALSVALPQRAKILVNAAVILGNAHFVVVYHDDDARAKFGCCVETFESLAAA